MFSHSSQTASESRPELSRFLASPSHLALCFFTASAIVLGIAAACAWLLVQTSRFAVDQRGLTVPPAFFISTLFLVIGSWTLHRACWYVRIEQQLRFRRHLGLALVTGTAFVAVQSYGLWCLLQQRSLAAALGLKEGAFAFVLMHGVHFLVALLFLVFVFLRALADRYDHEYSWGVTFCTWFWHALGIVWVAIVAAFAIASTVLLPI